MITLNVRRNRQGDLLILNPQPPKGVRYVFAKSQPTTPLQKTIRAFWREFDKMVDEGNMTDCYKKQQNAIKKLAKVYFGIDLTWTPPNPEADGWPTHGYWYSNKRFITTRIKELAK